MQQFHHQNQRGFYNRSRGNSPRFGGKRKSNKLVQSAFQLETAIKAAQLLKQTSLPETVATYTPVHAFNDFAVSPILKENVLRKYSSPMPIQDQVIGEVLNGNDVIGIANTGTGKTGAFLIPLIEKVFKDRKNKVLIIVPTRELAAQINDELGSFSRGMGIFSAVLIGGANIARQKNDLRRNPNFVIGTPGRIKELVQERILQLGWYSTVVIDEADRMVDIGFIADIQYFISLLPKNRQSLFFSATVSGKVREILNGFVRNPVTVSVKQKETLDTIEQEVVRCANGEKKIDRLHNLLTEDGFEKVLIFGRTKWGVQKLTDELIKRGFRAGAIHGNKNQNQRQRILDQFKKNDISILLATDVASRGLDIPDVSHVINYEMPGSFDDYVHRIGRTGRANKKGTALTFVE